MAEDVTEIITKIIATDDFFKKAQYIDLLRKEKNVTLAEISRQLKLKPSYTAHIIRLLKLPYIIIDGYYAKLVSATHLFILSRLQDEKKMIEAYETVLAKSLSAQQTDDLIREMIYDIKPDANMLTRDEIKTYNKKFQEVFHDIELKIIQTRVRGKIVCEIKGGAKDTSLALRSILEKLTQDNSGVKRVIKNLFVLE